MKITLEGKHGYCPYTVEFKVVDWNDKKIKITIVDDDGDERTNIVVDSEEVAKALAIVSNL